ncbi:3-phosphoinositide-dependent kinase 1 protein [Rutstroemia sp. NJR-2017a BVV2]|nr:3-phosphoinositide-dependent kinase 1 protein [Rutstroemia sp. NJR-2017a BVV2]
MPSLMNLINQKLELYRLEKRYTRRRNRRSTFVSDAVYVDGEYYSPNSYSYSANCTAGTDSDSGSKTSEESKASKDNTGKSSVTSKRMSMMDWRRGSVRENKQTGGTRVSVREMKWDGSVRS